MKKIVLFLILATGLILTLQPSFAQIPQRFNYQAVVRNTAGQLMPNTKIGIRVMIHDQSASGPVIYIEIYQKTTNDFGMLNLEVGSGPAYVGDFSNINWGNGPKFLEIQMDVTGGINYNSMGTTQLLSVPYALYSENVLNTKPFDLDSFNELQNLVLAGRFLSITNGNTVILNDVDSTNELQKLTFNNDSLSLSKGGNKFYLPYLKSQLWSKNGTSVYYNSGNVGIGTSNPMFNLSVSSVLNTWLGIESRLNVGFAGLYINKGSVTGMTNGVVTFATGGNSKWHMGMIKDDNFSISQSAVAPDGTFYVDGSKSRIGIGTTSPQANLDIISQMNAYMRVSSTDPSGSSGIYINKGMDTSYSNGSIIYLTDNSFTWAAGTLLNNDYSVSRKLLSPDGSFHIRYSNGNVGIGTTSPAYRLDINDSNNAIVSVKGLNTKASSCLLLNKGSATANNNSVVTWQTGGSEKWSTGTIKNDNFSISKTSVNADGTFTISRINSRVGIGTTNPQSRLDVTDSTSATGLFYGATATANAGIIISKGSTTASTNGMITWRTGITDRWYAGCIKDDNFSISKSSGASDGSFFINRVSGYTGIGTFNPLYKLDLRDNTQAYASLMAATATGSAGLYINKGATTASTNGVITWLTGSAAKWYMGNIRSDNFAISRSIISADGTFFILKSNGYIGINTVNPRNGLQINQNIRVPGYPLRFVSDVDNYGTQFRQSSVNFLIEKIDSTANPVPTTLIDIDYNQATLPFQPWQNNTMNLGSASFAWKNVYGVNAYQQTSDARLKKGILDLDYGLNTIMQLHPVSFYWLNNDVRERKIGFLAQEVIRVVPEVVKHDTFSSEQVNRWKEEGRQVPYNDVYSMAPSDLVPVLVKAIQEQQQMILKLQEEVKELKEKNNK